MENTVVYIICAGSSSCEDVQEINFLRITNCKIRIQNQIRCVDPPSSIRNTQSVVHTFHSRWSEEFVENYQEDNKKDHQAQDLRFPGKL